MNIVIPMAGLGSRFSDAGYTTPKPFIEIEGKPMILEAVNTLGFDGNYIFIIRKDEYIKNKMKEIFPDSQIIEVDYLTDGPASSVMLAKEFINNDEELIVANCDQIMWWDSETVIKQIRVMDYDGVVVTYHETTPKNSYARINRKGYVTKMAEKQVISNVSLNGIHYWKKGKYFIESTESMVEKNIRFNNEFYVSLTYNQMIEKGLKVGIYHIPNEFHNAVGTPDDLNRYFEKISTYESL
jgi:NDP-sugar pyrophosphorylase family protein